LTEGSDSPIVFTPARLHSQKGHSYLLEAAALVPQALFVLAGDARNGSDSNNRRPRWVSRIGFGFSAIGRMCVGFPLAVLEAMAAAKPIVATDIGGADEAIIQGVTGRQSSRSLSRSIAIAIVALRSDTPEDEIRALNETLFSASQAIDQP
jgi:glycosyltransferase involved in cell wall biosynthesis